MALTKIEYGSLASSEVMNDNNEYLENKILELSEIVTTNAATVNSNMATMNTNFNNSIDSTKEDIEEEVDSLFSENGLYVDTYMNGRSWYREFFSDAEKTNRIWIEQGGTCTTNTTTTLLKEMSNTNYTLTLGRCGAYNEAEFQYTGRTTTSFYIRNNKGYQYECDFYVCGT